MMLPLSSPVIFFWNHLRVSQPQTFAKENLGLGVDLAFHLFIPLQLEQFLRLSWCLLTLTFWKGTGRYFVAGPSCSVGLSAVLLGGCRFRTVGRNLTEVCSLCFLPAALICSRPCSLDRLAEGLSVSSPLQLLCFLLQLINVLLR